MRKNFILLLLLQLLIFNSCTSKNSKKMIINGDGKKIVEASQIISGLKNGMDIEITNCIIKGELDFSKVDEPVKESQTERKIYISASVSFFGCTFENHIVSNSKIENTNTSVEFQKNITLNDCKFKEDFNFKDVIVNGAANFTGSSFSTSNFEGAVFYAPNISFSNCFFNEEAKFQRSKFFGNVSFVKSVFNGKTTFQNAIFYGNVQFLAAKFQKQIELDGITAHQMLLFNTAEFFENLEISYSYLYGRTEFKDVKFITKTIFKNNVFYGVLKFTGASIKGEFNFLNNQCLLLKPDTEGIKKSEDVKFNFDNSFYQINQKIQTDNF